MGAKEGKMNKNEILT